MNKEPNFEVKLNQLQREFYNSFIDSFPEFVNEIEFEQGIVDPENFCFSIKSPSEDFGNLYFDIDDTEITVFTNFDHIHFSTYNFDSEKDIQKRIQLTCVSVVDYIKDFITGNIILEFKLLGDQILQVRQYHKDNSTLTPNKSIYLSFARLKNAFLRKSAKQKTEIKKVNWFGELT